MWKSVPFFLFLFSSVAFQAMGLTLTSVSPKVGPSAGGNRLTLKGTGFFKGLTFTVGGVVCKSPNIISANQATCILPPGKAGIKGVVVIPGGRLQPATLNNAYTYQAAPTVTSVTPIAGPLAGGNPLTLTGTGFLKGLSVTVGGISCPATFVSSTPQATCVLPAKAAGTYDVVLSNSDGQSASRAGAYTYQAAPTVTSVTPSAGPLAGGNPLTLTGTGFLKGLSVTVGGISCPATFVSSTQATCVLPAKAAGTYDVVLSNSDSQTANTKTYTYRNDPASVTLSAQPSSELGLAIPVTATFDKDVTGFDATAVTVSPSGSVQSWQGSGKSYQFEIVPAVQGLLQIQINGANIRDAIGNTGIKTPASLTVSVTTPTDSVSLNTQGVLEIHLASAGSQATLFPDQGFYRITGNKIQKQTFNMTAVNQISVKGNLLPDQTFRLGASNGTGVVHPLAVDENVDVTFILGIVNSRGNVAINSRQVVLGADITSVGSQTYKAAVEISGNRNLSSTSSITFNGSIDSSLLIFADPDSAPERTDLTKNFPNITLTLVTKAKPGWAEQEYTVAARKSWIVRSPTEVFAPTGNYLFGYSFDDDGRLGLNVSDGTFLRARFSLPVRQVAFDFTPNSSDPSVNGYPYLQVFTDSFWGDDENPWYLVPERVWEKLWGNRAGADVLSVSSLSSGTLRAPADISRDTRPIRRAEASWISASEWSEGSIDHLQATLWQKPIVTLSLTGQANLPGNVGERLRIITNGSVSKSVAPHAFAGGWSGYLAFTQNGQRSASQFQLTLGQTETQVTGTLQSANGNFNGVVSGMVTDDDFNGTLTLSSGPCTGTSIPFKLTEFENEGNIQLGDAGACSDYAPQMYRMQRSR